MTVSEYDLSRLDRAIRALENARKVAAHGDLFASFEGLVALEACHRLWQGDDFEAMYQEIWLEAGCPLSDEVDDAVVALGNQDMRRAA